jgi:hypothetical protein
MSTKDPHNEPDFWADNFISILGVMARHWVFVLIGVAGLILVFCYSGPYFNLVHSYCGNLTASFACYFLVRSIITLSVALTRRFVNHRTILLVSSLIALLVVELFEWTDGFFAVMTNVYDPLDYGVNGLGVALAVVVDIFASYILKGRERRILKSLQDYQNDPNAT